MPTVTKPIILDDTGKAIVEAIKELSSKSLTGPPGPAGSAGPMGPEGPAGPSGVNLDDADFVLYDERGNATKGTMTQKSITKYIKNIEVGESTKDRVIIGESEDDPTAVFTDGRSDFHGEIDLDGKTIIKGGSQTSNNRIVIGESLSNPTVIITPDALMVKKITDLNGKTITGGGSSSAVTITSDLPSYYADIIAQKSEEINTIQFASGRSFDLFFWTDSHVKLNQKHSTAIIASLQKNTTTKMSVFGGDCIGSWNEDNGDRAYLDALDHVKMVRMLGPENVYTVRGNHDVWAQVEKTSDVPSERKYVVGAGDLSSMKRVGYSSSGASSYIYSLMGTGFVGNSNDNTCTYGYKDDDFLKIRIIFMDTNNLSWDATYGVSQTEMKWIIEEAIQKAPAGYNFVIFGHISPLRAVKYDDPTQTTVLSMIKAINEKTSFSYSGKEYSFTGTGKVLMHVAGHEHGDNYAFRYGTLFVVSHADALYNNQGDYSTLYLFDQVPKYSRVAGNTEEQSVDWFCLDIENKRFSDIRIGAGFNRFANLDPITMSVGGTYTITPSISASKWFSIDASSNSEAKADITRNVCSVSTSGVVTANNSGEATVYAIASDGTSEAFSIVVN